MVRSVMCVLLCFLASPAFSQSAYVGGVFGTNTTLLDSYGSGRQRDTGSAETAPAIGARVGRSLGTRWGVELEFSSAFEVTNDEQGRELFGKDPVLAFVSGGASGFITHAQQRSTTLCTGVWLAHPLTPRIDLALIGGASFDRVVREERYDIFYLGVIPPFATGETVVGFGDLVDFVAPTTLVQYHVGVLAGVETRFAVGEHLRLIPGARMHGFDGGWAIRPAVAVGWLF